ncbi:hypothetical protein CSOJ01_02318 [Colletotrichum sojae]|uniref:Uncharacterized protein n=1 Tax=Colletotrichum sojae TaxID=2175907 RepID=A0A8H6N2Y4_9PEZI|nr:hypothetical protein CSOJ01_02318 [Colletotrichum sojae]
MRVRTGPRRSRELAWHGGAQQMITKAVRSKRETSAGASLRSRPGRLGLAHEGGETAAQQRERGRADDCLRRARDRETLEKERANLEHMRAIPARN